LATNPDIAAGSGARLARSASDARVESTRLFTLPVLDEWEAKAKAGRR